jgi:hypothetical protein
MTLLEIIQECFSRLGLQQPQAAAQTQDINALQAVALLNEEVRALMRSPTEWKCLQAELTINATTGQQVYPVPADLGYFVDDTTFSRSLQWRVIGPITAQQWQLYKSQPARAAFPAPRFRLRNEGLEFLDLVSTGDVFVCEYQRNTSIRNGLTPKARFTADDDTCLFPDELLVLALRFRWLRAKGLTYDHEFKEYTDELQSLQGRDNGGQTLSLIPSSGSVLISQYNLPDSI